MPGRWLEAGERLPAEVEALLALGQAAAGAWGGLVSPDATERAVRIHRNRLRTVGIKFF